MALRNFHFYYNTCRLSWVKTTGVFNGGRVKSVVNAATDVLVCLFFTRMSPQDKPVKRDMKKNFQKYFLAGDQIESSTWKM